MSSAVSWRKAILLNRSVVISAFGRAFPRHDFTTLRLSRSWPDPIIPWANEEAWAESARRYHEDRKRNRFKVPM
jgi:hypothetical protein